MSFYDTHYRTENGWACGHRAQRTSSEPGTTDASLVTCWLCHRTGAFKAARKVQLQQSERRRARLEAAGFDPDKRVTDLTEAEVKEFIAYRKHGRV